MRRTTLAAIAGSGLAGMLALPAMAGVLDSPVPDMDPSHSERVIYIIPNVIKNNNLETEFNCTNLERTTVRIGVEIFDRFGNGPLNDISSGVGDGAQDVPPGGAITIGTGNTAAIHEDEVIQGLPTNVRGGSARIVSTSKRIMCQAFVVDEVNVPDFANPGQTPAMLPLKVIFRKQRGD